MCVYTVVAEYPGKAFIERFKWPPIAMGKIQPTGMHIAPSGHAWQRADIVLVKGHGFSRKPVKVWGRNRRAAVGTKRHTIQGIKKYENRSHKLPPQNIAVSIDTLRRKC